MDRFDALRLFTRIVELGSFTRAADELGLPRATATHAIKQLEARLQSRLLERTTRQVRTTVDGQAFYERCVHLLAELEEAEGALRNVAARPRGVVRVEMHGSHAVQLVLPRLAEFHTRYPQVQVELFIDPHLVDLVAEGFDAGVRLGESLARDMIALPIGPMHRQVVVGTPDYFARHGVPQTPADLVDHACAVHRLTNGRLMAWEFTRDGQDFDVAVSGPLVSNESGIVYRAALGGTVLTQCFVELAEADLAAGRLVSVLDDWQVPFAGFHIYYPAREHLPPKLRVFVEFLREGLPARL